MPGKSLYCFWCSVTKSCPTLCDPVDYSTPGFPVLHYQSVLKLMSIKSVMPFSRLILCHPLLLLPSIFPSIRVLSNELALCIRWSDYWSFNFSISPSNEYSGLISLLSEELSRIFSSNTIWKYQFFSAQSSLWSDSHICTWLLEKNIALTIWTFVSKMMSLLFNTLPRFVTGFLPRSQHFFFF